MTQSISGSQTYRFSMLVMLLAIAGCASDPNYYKASMMPKGLRIARAEKTQEVDFGRLASSSGSSTAIGPGDYLEVSISSSLKKDDQISVPVIVDDDGFVELPGDNVPKIKLGGYEPQVAGGIVRGALMNAKYYRNPIVAIDVKTKKMNRIRVVGAVNEPMVVELSPNTSDVVTAIAAAGGLAENASPIVTVRNPQPSGSTKRKAIAGGPNTPYSTVSDSVEISGGMEPYSINLISAAQSGALTEMIEDGGVVHVNKHDPEPISITGLVREPGSFEYNVDKPPTVIAAISLAGGRSNQLADKILVIRPLAGSNQRAVIHVSLRRAKRNSKEDILLGPGDIVTVEQTPATVVMEALQLIRFGVSGSAAIF